MSRSEKLTVVTLSSAPEFCRPRQFFRQAAKDLRSSIYLALVLTARDIKSQYRQSLFGVLWAVFPPIVMTIAFILLKNENLLVINEGNTGFELFVLVGNLLWQGFADAVSSPLKSVQSGKSMLAKISFPREALVLAGLCEVFFYFIIRLLIAVPIVAGLGVSLQLSLILAPAGMITLIALGWAIGLALIPLGALYKDVELALGLLVTLLYFATPAIYSPGWSSSQSMLSYNPISTLISTTRDIITGNRSNFPLEAYIILLITFIAILIGWLLFRLAMPHIIKRLQA